LPAALSLKDGWLVKETVDSFVTHANIVHEELGDVIDSYIILNEPWCSSWLGYFTGEHAPGRKSVDDFFTATHNLLLAQARVVRLLKSKDSTSKIATTYCLSLFYSNSTKSED
jgi:beta-glucosidase